ncbi:peptide chain release factor 1 [Candidatus Parvarchaeota archaeon]|nr:peptide chain release factor 1 [Candidatus Parvarchaeota archaeon]
MAKPMDEAALAQLTRKRYELKKQLRVLSEAKGTGTELISVYIPPKYPIHEITNKLKEEAGQASNIKSKSTRKNVIDALERLLQYLKIFRESPENGIAIFAGNVSQNPAKIDIELYSIVPPQPLQIQLYRCDSRFFLEPLAAMADVKESYGLVVLDGREATLATLRGTQIQILKRLNSTAHAKIRKGGQSARRYERLIEESIELYYKRVGEAMDKYFVTSVKGVIIGGPGPTKDNFVKMSPFNYQIKVMGVVDTGYTDEQGLRELMAKSADILTEQEAVKEKQVIDRFIREIVQDGLVVYGEAQVREALSIKKAEKLLVSAGLDYKRHKFVCQADGCEKFKNIPGGQEPEIPRCDRCNAAMKRDSDSLLIDELMDLAAANDIEAIVVSTDTSEGMQFLQSFYGIGAFLRYK